MIRRGTIIAGRKPRLVRVERRRAWAEPEIRTAGVAAVERELFPGRREPAPSPALKPPRRPLAAEIRELFRRSPERTPKPLYETRA